MSSKKVPAKKAKPKLPPVGVVAAVNRIRSSVSKLHARMVPPPVALLERITGMWEAQAVYVAAELGVADALAKGPREVVEVARELGAHPEALYRVLRALTVSGLLEEPRRGQFRLTAMGECLRTDHPSSMRYMAIIQGSYNWAHWGELLHCVRTGKPAVEKVRGKPFFEFLADDRLAAENFDRAMTNISRMEMEAILAVYDFSAFGTLADVGGGHGAFLTAILDRTPRLKGIVFDMPAVVKGAPATLKAAGVEERCQVLAGNFFESVPAGADAVVMKHILHDWSDEESIRILKNVRAKLPAKGKLLLVETVVPAPGEKHFSKYLDLEMLVVTTGKERTLEEWTALLERAGFRLDRVVPSISMASVIEASPA